MYRIVDVMSNKQIGITYKDRQRAERIAEKLKFEKRILCFVEGI